MLRMREGGQNTDGSRWEAFYAPRWSVCAQEVQAGGAWAVYVLPDEGRKQGDEGEGYDGRRMLRLATGPLLEQEAIRLAELVGQALVHVAREDHGAEDEGK